MPDYFTLAELRALPDVSSATTYPDARVEAVSAYITAVIEREVGTSFVARTVTDEVHSGGTVGIVLDSPYVLSVTSVTVDGTAVTGYTFTAHNGVLKQYATGYTAPTAWAAGTDNVRVTYSAGYSAAPPADVKDAALWGTRARLLDTGSNAVINDRRSSITNEVGGTTSFVLAGEDRPTGYPEVDAVILGWKAKIRVPSVS